MDARYESKYKSLKLETLVPLTWFVYHYFRFYILKLHAQ